MILTCPSCTTRYFAEDEEVGARARRLRCAACGHVWTHASADDGPNSDGDGSGEERADAPRWNRTSVERMRAGLGGGQSPGHDAARRNRAETDRKAKFKGVAIAWSATAVAGVTLLAGAWLFRAPLVAVWPQAAGAYAAIGAPVNAFGLDFADVKAERKISGVTPVLVISGSVRNVSDQPHPAPIVRVGLRNDAGKEVYAWSLGLEVAELGPGETARFGTRLESPPLAAFDLEVRFERRASAPFIQSASESVPAAASAEPPAASLAAPDDHGAVAPEEATQVEHKPAGHKPAKHEAARH